MTIHIFLCFLLILKIVKTLKSNSFSSYIYTPKTFLHNNKIIPNKKLLRKFVNRIKLLDDTIKSNEYIIKITDNATNKIKELQKECNDDYLILKLYVENGGCKGLKYKLNPIKKNEIEEDDYIQQFDELKFILSIDSTSVIYIYNNTLDYSNDLISGGFKFINPNATKKCGCGKSFNV
ncbi:iron-sulfur assembly protein,putative [Plasmodium sp. DRC-Itaito]|nr:iron-sulfur assembly protein,putative [Plasmodium sp. DRC-Itaito]